MLAAKLSLFTVTAPLPPSAADVADAADAADAAVADVSRVSSLSLTLMDPIVVRLMIPLRLLTIAIGVVNVVVVVVVDIPLDADTAMPTSQRAGNVDFWYCS